METKSLVKNDVTTVINKFARKINVTHRYASFDFCYRYFYENRGEKLLGENLQYSCFQLWTYLASWGMLRGGSELLQKSAACLIPVIEHIAQAPKELWKIDVEDYNSNNIKCICKEYKAIEKCLLREDSLGKPPTKTLVTKIMLGVYACIPAFDQFFTQTFKGLFENECGFTRVNENALNCIKKFYDANSDSFSQKIKVLNFNGSENENLFYKKLKLIDMYGFTKSFK